MIRDAVPWVGFSYRTGVRNNRNVIVTPNIFPISLTTPFNKDKTSPNPRVNKINGIETRGNNKAVG